MRKRIVFVENPVYAHLLIAERTERAIYLNLQAL